MQKVLKDIIGELLDEGQITQARRLSALFGISTTDLDIVLVSIISPTAKLHSVRVVDINILIVSVIL